MRVISGSAKGRRLKKVPGDSTRPIMDRVKENLFNILGSWVAGSRWLDLFAGTGQVGIEALSRGADEVVFIDNVRPAIGIIQENLEHTGLTPKAKVFQMDAYAYLRRQRNSPFDVIFVAPPQYKGLWKEVLAIVDKRPSNILTNEGIIIVQIDPREFVDLDLENLELDQQRTYGNTRLCIYEIRKSSYQSISG